MEENVKNNVLILNNNNIIATNFIELIEQVRPFPLPANCIYTVQLLNGDYLYVIEQEPAYRTIKCTDLGPYANDKSKTYHLYVPYMIFIVRLNKTSTFINMLAFSRPEKTYSLDSILYRAPFSNISAGDDVCLGIHNDNKSGVADYCDGLINSFWANTFNSDYTSQLSVYNRERSIFSKYDIWKSVSKNSPETVMNPENFIETDKNISNIIYEMNKNSILYHVVHHITNMEVKELYSKYQNILIEVGSDYEIMKNKDDEDELLTEEVIYICSKIILGTNEIFTIHFEDINDEKHKLIINQRTIKHFIIFRAESEENVNSNKLNFENLFVCFSGVIMKMTYITFKDNEEREYKLYLNTDGTYKTLSNYDDVQHILPLKNSDGSYYIKVKNHGEDVCFKSGQYLYLYDGCKLIEFICNGKEANFNISGTSTSTYDMIHVDKIWPIQPNDIYYECDITLIEKDIATLVNIDDRNGHTCNNVNLNVLLRCLQSDEKIIFWYDPIHHQFSNNNHNRDFTRIAINDEDIVITTEKYHGENINTIANKKYNLYSCYTDEIRESISVDDKNFTVGNTVKFIKCRLRILLNITLKSVFRIELITDRFVLLSNGLMIDIKMFFNSFTKIDSDKYIKFNFQTYIRMMLRIKNKITLENVIDNDSLVCVFIKNTSAKYYISQPYNINRYQLFINTRNEDVASLSSTCIIKEDDI